MTPEQQQQKQRILDAHKELRDAYDAHKSIIEKHHSSARCPICLKDFGWWCPKSPTHTCDYSPPGDYDFLGDTVRAFCVILP